MHATLRLAVAAGAALATLGATQAPPPPILDALFGESRETVALDALAARAPLGAGENFRVVEVARDDHSSHHVVAIRDREVPHRHDRHDLFVVLLEGHGRMHLDGEAREVGEGSILYVPRGTLHSFENRSQTPASAYAIYVPPFDGKDRVEVE